MAAMNWNLRLIITLSLQLVVAGQLLVVAQGPDPLATGTGPDPLAGLGGPDPLAPERGAWDAYVLRFYKHRTTASDTQWLLAQPVAGFEATTLLGQVRVQDDALTETEEPESRVLGRARGAVLFESSDETPISMEQLFTANFDDGAFDSVAGSSIIYRGFDPILETVREVAIVGGTGSWSFATGYCVQTLVYQDAERLTIEYVSYIFVPRP